MRVASWNVNSIRARLPRVLDWLAVWSPDILCLQETKVIDDDFPREPFADLGYHLEVMGQKTYNGVALICREKPVPLLRGLPDDPPEADKRIIGARFGDLSVINIYAPNGTELGSERFAYKLEWYRRLHCYLDETFSPTDQLIVAGDYNIAQDDRDLYDPDAWRGKLLYHEDELKVLGELMEWGLFDAFREFHSEPGLYSWWDYRAGMFHKGLGLRIDFALVTESVRAQLKKSMIDRDARKGVKPSDHAPLIVDL